MGFSLPLLKPACRMEGLQACRTPNGHKGKADPIHQLWKPWYYCPSYNPVRNYITSTFHVSTRALSSTQLLTKIRTTNIRAGKELPARKLTNSPPSVRRFPRTFWSLDDSNPWASSRPAKGRAVSFYVPLFSWAYNTSCCMIRLGPRFPSSTTNITQNSRSQIISLIRYTSLNTATNQNIINNVHYASKIQRNKRLQLIRNPLRNTFV